MRLAASDAHLAVFENTNPEKPERLTYCQEGDGALVALLERQRDGRPTTTEFRMARVAVG